jgi:para-nitrobenzyl esterase
LSAIPMGRAEQTGVEYAKSIGAENLEELRSIDADSIVNSATRFGPFRFAMTVDGYFFPREPLAIYEAGEQARVPLLVGWNSEESNYRGLLGNSKPDKMNFEKKVRELYGKDAEEILRVYTAASDAEVEQVATELAGDRFIGYSTWKWADVHLKTSGQPVYRYLFERPRPDIRTEMGDVVPGLAGGVQKNTTGEKPPRAKGAVHSAEIEYAMGNLSSNHVYAWEEDDYKVSRLMQQYFVNFIKTGNPSGNGLPQWPPATSSEVPVMHINVESGANPEANSDRYQLLDRLAR